ncbi:MAG: hypothetical protein J6Z02_07230 [Lachnospiraceae bacterium]|nr:hypothetical protein [Lachnospiraceae bacterium]
MQIVFGILWGLLFIFLFLLLLILLVLFVPVRYRVSGDYEKEVNADIGVSWLLHIVSVRFVKNGESSDLILKIFGIRFGKKKEKEETGKKKEKKAVKKEKEKKPKRKRVFGKKRKPEDTEGMSRFERFMLKAGYVCEDLDALKRTLQSDSSRRAFSLVFEETVRLFKAVLPKKLSLYLKYGTGDGYSLANALIGLSVIYGLYGDHVDIEPDWDNEVLVVRGKAKGRIILFTLMLICIKVLFNKDIKKLKRRLESLTHFEEEEGNENGGDKQ